MSNRSFTCNNLSPYSNFIVISILEIWKLRLREVKAKKLTSGRDEIQTQTDSKPTLFLLPTQLPRQRRKLTFIEQLLCASQCWQGVQNWAR